MKYVYLSLAIIGLVLPYSEFVPFVMENGLDIALLIKQLMANHISAFGGYDVIVLAVVLLAFIIYENKKKRIRYSWLAVLGTFTVDVSFGLPLFNFLKKINNRDFILA